MIFHYNKLELLSIAHTIVKDDQVIHVSVILILDLKESCTTIFMLNVHFIASFRKYYVVYITVQDKIKLNKYVHVSSQHLPTDKYCFVNTKHVHIGIMGLKCAL